MALDLKNLSFSRQILPLIAIVGLLAAVAFILAGLPDRELSEPGREPPRAPEQLAAEARVAGSGVVEPSSETIQIGSALSGLITGLYVQPGDRVGEGDLLFTVDEISSEGATWLRSRISATPDFSSSSPETAETATGTSARACSRPCARTMMTLPLSTSAASIRSASSVFAAPASWAWAIAGVRAIAQASAPRAH